MRTRTFSWRPRECRRAARLRSGAPLRERLHHRAERKQRDDRDDLTDEDDAVEVERRPPARLAIFDDPRAGGSRRQTEPTAAVARGVASGPAAADDGRRRNERYAFFLI